MSFTPKVNEFHLQNQEKKTKGEDNKGKGVRISLGRNIKIEKIGAEPN